jgi:hypothetical protein
MANARPEWKSGTSGAKRAGPVNRPQLRRPELRLLEAPQPELRNHNSLAAVHQDDLSSG